MGAVQLDHCVIGQFCHVFSVKLHRAGKREIIAGSDRVGNIRFPISAKSCFVTQKTDHFLRIVPGRGYGGPQIVKIRDRRRTVQIPLITFFRKVLVIADRNSISHVFAVASRNPGRMIKADEISFLRYSIQFERFRENIFGHRLQQRFDTLGKRHHEPHLRLCQAFSVASQVHMDIGKRKYWEGDAEFSTFRIIAKILHFFSVHIDRKPVFCDPGGRLRFKKPETYALFIHEINRNFAFKQGRRKRFRVAFPLIDACTYRDLPDDVKISPVIKKHGLQPGRHPDTL